MKCRPAETPLIDPISSPLFCFCRFSAIWASFSAKARATAERSGSSPGRKPSTSGLRLRRYAASEPFTRITLAPTARASILSVVLSATFASSLSRLGHLNTVP